MSNTLGRIIKTVPAGTAGNSNLFGSLQALDSGAAQIFLTSNVNHYADESSYRTLASVPGFLYVSRPSPTGAVTPSAPSDFDWFGRFEDTPQPAVQCLGTFVINRVARDLAAWPLLVLRARVEPPASLSDKLGAILVTVPGSNSNAAAVTDPTLYATTSISGASWTDLTLTVPLSSSHVAYTSRRPLLGAPSSGVPGDSEIVATAQLTAWCSFYSTSGKCQVVAITLGLEPP